MRERLSLVFALVLAAVFAAALIGALGFRAQARLFPVTIATVGLVLALAQAAIELRRLKSGPSMSASQEPALESVVAAELPPAVRVRRTVGTLVWIVGFATSVWLIGFPFAVALMGAAYLRFEGKESIPVSAAFGLISGAVFYGLFFHAVRIPFDDGQIIYWIFG